MTFLKYALDFDLHCGTCPTWRRDQWATQAPTASLPEGTWARCLNTMCRFFRQAASGSSSRKDREKMMSCSKKPSLGKRSRIQTQLRPSSERTQEELRRSQLPTLTPTWCRSHPSGFLREDEGQRWTTCFGIPLGLRLGFFVPRLLPFTPQSLSPIVCKMGTRQQRLLTDLP